jgi:hypothetical protein
MSVYVNGNLIQTVSETHVGETNNPIQFGAYGGGNFYTGLMDNMRFYQSTLTQAQITEIYHNSKKVRLIAGGDGGTIALSSDNGVSWTLPSNQPFATRSITRVCSASNEYSSKLFVILR